MELTVTHHITDAEIKKLQGLLKTFNSKFTDTTEWGTQVGVYCHDDSGEIVGGTIATKKGHWLCIDYLWMKEDSRHKGIGRRLIRLLEVEGNVMGCTDAMVDTFSFQALPFYEKLGYALHFSLNDFPCPGVERHFLTKKLAVMEIHTKVTEVNPPPPPLDATHWR